VAARQHPQHCNMVLRNDSAETSLVESHDRHRTRIIGVVLLRPRRIQNPSSRSQSRRHVHHMLTSSHQLLRQQIAVAIRRLDRPATVTEPFRPGQQLPKLTFRRLHLQLGDSHVATIHGSSRMRPFVRGRYR